MSDILLFGTFKAVLFRAARSGVQEDCFAAITVALQAVADTLAAGRARLVTLSFIALNIKVRALLIYCYGGVGPTYLPRDGGGGRWAYSRSPFSSSDMSRNTSTVPELRPFSHTRR